MKYSVYRAGFGVLHCIARTDVRYLKIGFPLFSMGVFLMGIFDICEREMEKERERERERM